MANGSLAMTSLFPWAGAALALVWLTGSGCGDARSATTADAAGLDSSTADFVDAGADERGGHASDGGVDVDGEGGHSCISVTGAGLEPWLDLQIVGRHHDDWGVLQLAHAFEQATRSAIVMRAKSALGSQIT